MNKTFKILFWIAFAITALWAFLYVATLLIGCHAGLTYQVGLNCCRAIENFGNAVGLSYFATNILIFVILEPILVIISAVCCFWCGRTNSHFQKEIAMWITRLCLFAAIILTVVLSYYDPMLWTKMMP